MFKVNSGKRRGFTLIEILMVVVILGIAGAIVIPQLSPRDDLKASAAARTLMADLIYAQNLAITTQKNHYVEFDVANQTYQVLVAPDMTVVQHPVNKTPFKVVFGGTGSESIRDAKLDAATFRGQSTTNAYPIVGFDELGTPLVYPDGGPAETLSSGSLIVKSGLRKLKIAVEPFTGQIGVTSSSGT